MRQEEIQEITLTAMFGAIIAIMAFVPYLGFIPNPFFAGSLTIIHIVVIIGGIVLGRKRSWLLGTIFGVMSLLIAFIRPSGPVDLIFQNVLISVLPRTLFGIVIFELYNLLNKVSKNRVLNISLTMFISSFLHTIFVVLALYIFKQDALLDAGLATADTLENMFIFFTSVFLVTGLLEAGLALVVGTPVALALIKYNEFE